MAHGGACLVGWLLSRERDERLLRRDMMEEAPGGGGAGEWRRIYNHTSTPNRAGIFTRYSRLWFRLTGLMINATSPLLFFISRGNTKDITGFCLGLPKRAGK